MGLPTGPAVTFLFTDIEGSTRLERMVGSDAWAAIVARHDELLRQAIESNGGVIVKTEGDSFFAAFDRPDAAAAGAVDAQRAVAAEAWPETSRLRVRMGLHLGEGRLRGGRAAGDPEDYVGIDVNYAARIAAAGNGGQVVVSDALVTALGGATPREGRLVDEGLRAVKDFDEPLRLHRLVVAGAADDDRPLRTVEAPTNLPGEVTSLIGREAEVGRVAAALDDHRIVTLVGPGGSGKTRLALGVGRETRDRFPHGVWFVDLAAVREPALVESSIADALAVREAPEKPVGEMLRDHLRPRTCLVILDNLEQLLPPVAETVSGLARNAPALRLLLTSRELLRISGERGYPVPPLDVNAGIDLFEARARAIRPDFTLDDASREVVRDICERLGGIPLAIELAAARVRLMAPSLILERLGGSLDLAGSARDVPERQRTLRGAIAWSHDLLSDAEKTLFRRLATFAGGWTAELAAAVADPDGALGLDGLESLADKSLIRIHVAGAADGQEARFEFHPLLREFAQEQLLASGEQDAVEQRHAAAILELAEREGPNILGPRGDLTIRRLDQEIHNVRAALVWATTHHESAIGVRVLGAVWRWFQQRGQLRQARSLLAQLLPQVAEPRIRIAGLAASGSLAYWMHDVEAAGEAYAERLALAEEIGDAALVAEAHYDIGFLSMLASDPAALRDHEQHALELYESVGDENGALRARQALTLALFLTGEYVRAAELQEADIETFRRTGSPFQVADTMTFLSAVYYRLGQPARAWQWMADALRFFSDNDNASGIARTLGMAAILLVEHGDAELGARAAGATHELARDKGVMIAPLTVLHLTDPNDLARDRLGPERADALIAEGAATPVGEMVEAVLALPPTAG